jgi:hypothetical protein
MDKLQIIWLQSIFLIFAVVSGRVFDSLKHLECLSVTGSSSHLLDTHCGMLRVLKCGELEGFLGKPVLITSSCLRRRRRRQWPYDFPTCTLNLRRASSSARSTVCVKAGSLFVCGENGRFACHV